MDSVHMCCPTKNLWKGLYSSNMEEDLLIFILDSIPERH